MIGASVRSWLIGQSVPRSIIEFLIEPAIFNTFFQRFFIWTVHILSNGLDSLATNFLIDLCTYSPCKTETAENRIICGKGFCRKNP